MRSRSSTIITASAFSLLLTLVCIYCDVFAARRVEAHRGFVQAGMRGKPSDASPQQKGLIGEYAFGRDTLCLLEQNGSLYFLVRSGRSFLLRETTRDHFTILGGSPFSDTTCVFQRDAKGNGTSFSAKAGIFKRIFFGGENGTTFRIKPLKTADELRKEALRASPPKEEGHLLKHDLVELTHLDPTIHLDIRYATTNNFMGAKFYSQAKAFLQRPAAEALIRVHRALRQQGYGLLIHDAYRPWYVTKMFWDATPGDQKIFVADPSKGSRHNRGCAVDLTLYDLQTGKPVEMVSGYDEFSHRAYPDYQGGTSLQRWHREFLRRVMEAGGFKVFEWEWWHFDYDNWKQYPIGTVTFEEIR